MFNLGQECGSLSLIHHASSVGISYRNLRGNVLVWVVWEDGS